MSPTQSKKLIENFNKHNGKLVVKMANRVYFKEDVRLQDDFRQIAKDTYDADLLKVDFKKNSKQLKNEINKWIEQETNKKLKDVLKKIDKKTVMMLINLVYFKGKWKISFDKENEVKPSEFTNLNGQKKRVEMLWKTDEYQYGRFKRYQILRLNFHDDSAMYVVLPDANVNLNDLLRELNPRRLNDELDELRPMEINLQLPKFELKTDIDLVPILKRLGVKRLFSSQADLSRISNYNGLRITSANQNAYISVDENGVEAAAATIMKHMATSMNKPEPLKFHVNRPFLFIIRLNGLNVFAGALKQLETGKSDL